MPADPLLSRRGLLAAGAVGLVAVSGCTGDDDPASSTTPTSAGDPDQDLVDRVVGQIDESLALVTFARTAEPSLRPPTRHLVRMHEAHLAALQATPPDVTGAGPTFASPAAALADVRRREQRLQRQLVAASEQAQSGALARLLASMSAAVSQAVAAGAGQ